MANKNRIDAKELRATAKASTPYIKVKAKKISKDKIEKELEGSKK